MRSRPGLPVPPGTEATTAAAAARPGAAVLQATSDVTAVTGPGTRRGPPAAAQAPRLTGRLTAGASDSVGSGRPVATVTVTVTDG